MNVLNVDDVVLSRKGGREKKRSEKVADCVTHRVLMQLRVSLKKEKQVREEAGKGQKSWAQTQIKALSHKSGGARLSGP